MKFLYNLPENLFLLLVATIPIQLGKHFWPSFAQVAGIRIDFLAPTIFLTDLTIFVFVLFWVVRFFLKKPPTKFPNKNFTLALGLFLLTFAISAAFSKNPALSFWFLAKTFEFAALAVTTASLDFSKLWKKLVLVAGISAIISVLLASFQFWQQQSVGLYFLGERAFNISTPAIAQVVLSGKLFLRPYATFPHPNVLAGYLSLVAVFVFFSKFPKKNLAKAAGVTILLIGVFLTFSRSVWIGLIISILTINIMTKNWLREPKTTFLLAGVFLLFLVFPQNLVFDRFWQITGSDVESFEVRLKLAKTALTMFTQNPFFGVGPGNFIPNLPEFWDYWQNLRFLQPVHNLPLLVLAETGIVGATSTAFLFGLTFRRIFTGFAKTPKALTAAWILILVVSSLDHYFWTLQQGQILLFIVLGLTWNQSLREEKT